MYLNRKYILHSWVSCSIKQTRMVKRVVQIFYVLIHFFTILSIAGKRKSICGIHYFVHFWIIYFKILRKYTFKCCVLLKNWSFNLMKWPSDNTYCLELCFIWIFKINSVLLCLLHICPIHLLFSVCLYIYSVLLVNVS